ncbi:MAG TPA: MobF family relaxase [Conexibacter sp.]|nr:MobF family relaxase [Conexibacter sp.]
MLSIGKVNGAHGRTGRYYTDAVASGAEDYYAGHGEAQGRWAGSAVGAFEVDGAVDAGAFHRLLNGLDPASGRVLRVASRGEDGELRAGVVRGFDLTFSAPKSVSVLYAAGDDRVAGEVRAALDAAPNDALRWLEQRACVVRRGAGGAIELPGDGFVGAAFRHRTSRAGDPQLHTHVVISNMARGPDGRWTALRGAYLYEHARSAGFVFQASMRAELTARLGVRWRESPTPGVYEIDGVPFELMRELSKRRVQVEQAMVEHAVTGTDGARVATLATRPAKDHQLDQATRLHDAWRALTAERGFGREEVAAVLAPERQMQLTGVPFDEIAAALLGPDGLTARESTFGVQEVVRGFAQALPAGASAAELEQLAARFLAGDEVVELPAIGTLGEASKPSAPGRSDALAHGGHEGEGTVAPDSAGASERDRRFTTRGLLEVERELLEGAHAGRDAGAGRCDERTVAAVLAGAPSASVEQRQMVRALTGRGDRVQVVRAPAGAGKTWTLDLARQAWQAEGHPVIGVALSRRAAGELREQARLDRATSIARLHLDVEREGGLARGCVLIVDEAAMVGTRDLHRLLGYVERADGLLVLVGGDHQLPAIHAGGAFTALAQRLDAIELNDNFRQQDPLERDRALALRHGAVDAWLHSGMRARRVVLGADPAQTRELVVADWLQDRQLGEPHEAIMLARSNADVRWLNDAARHHLKARGELTGDELTVAGRSFAVGDLVVARRNLSGGRIDNGTRATVVALDHEQQQLAVRTLDGSRTVTLDSDYLEARHLHHAYALTAHLAQGLSVDRVRILGGENGHSREWAYSAATRHRIAAHFYLTAPDAERLQLRERDPLRRIRETLGHSTAKTLALDTTTARPCEGITAASSAELRACRRALRELLAPARPRSTTATIGTTQSSSPPMSSSREHTNASPSTSRSSPARAVSGPRSNRPSPATAPRSTPGRPRQPNTSTPSPPSPVPADAMHGSDSTDQPCANSRRSNTSCTAATAANCAPRSRSPSPTPTPVSTPTSASVPTNPTGHTPGMRLRERSSPTATTPAASTSTNRTRSIGTSTAMCVTRWTSMSAACATPDQNLSLGVEGRPCLVRTVPPQDALRL